jgi:hypothetical protein
MGLFFVSSVFFILFSFVIRKNLIIFAERNMLGVLCPFVTCPQL